LYWAGHDLNASKKAVKSIVVRREKKKQQRCGGVAGGAVLGLGTGIAESSCLPVVALNRRKTGRSLMEKIVVLRGRRQFAFVEIEKLNRKLTLGAFPISDGHELEVAMGALQAKKWLGPSTPR